MQRSQQITVADAVRIVSDKKDMMLEVILRRSLQVFL